MKVKINIASYFLPYTDNQEYVDVEGNTVGECLQDLVRQFPVLKDMIFQKNGSLLEWVNVYRDKSLLAYELLDGPVYDGDILYVLYLIGGG